MTYSLMLLFILPSCELIEMPRRLFAASLAFIAFVVAAGDTQCALDVPPGWSSAGVFLPRNASSITSSRWSIGAETVDRGYSNPSAWLSYLPLVGAKAARIQGGWARCDPYGNGTYVWDWLDFTVAGISAANTTPWMQLSYGNPAYSGGGDSSAGSPIPEVGPAREAFMAWASAAVSRYAPLGVNTYEVSDAQRNCETG
jgi:hypothetical protein